MGVVIEGKPLAQQCKQEVAKRVKELKGMGVLPCLAVVLIGDNPASRAYVAGKERDCMECGILSRTIHLSHEVQEWQVLEVLDCLNSDDGVHGILVQLPLPEHLSAQRILAHIMPQKDVDGFTPLNVGLVAAADPRAFLPCTPAGCMEILRSCDIVLEGKHAVVVGRSEIVGKPLAKMLLNADCTVTLCHSKTRNLAELCRLADILVSAVGRPGLITADFVREGAVVIDVGISRGSDGKLCGDVDFEAVRERAAAITPVPGGVGLMTRAMLMKNTVMAAENAHRGLA